MLYISNKGLLHGYSNKENTIAVIENAIKEGYYVVIDVMLNKKTDNRVVLCLGDVVPLEEIFMEWLNTNKHRLILRVRDFFTASSVMEHLNNSIDIVFSSADTFTFSLQGKMFLKQGGRIPCPYGILSCPEFFTLDFGGFHKIQCAGILSSFIGDIRKLAENDGENVKEKLPVIAESESEKNENDEEGDDEDINDFIKKCLKNENYVYKD